LTTESRHAVDLAYALMIDPLSDVRAVRHAEFEAHLDRADGTAGSTEMTDEEKRAVLEAGIRARGEDAHAKVAGR
jgi:hypothetical protein